MTKAKTMLTKLGVSNFDQKSGELSGGQKKRLALVSVLLKEADILLLHELISHPDHEMADWLEEQLKQRKEALVMITHDRYLRQCVQSDRRGRQGKTLILRHELCRLSGIKGAAGRDGTGDGAEAAEYSSYRAGMGTADARARSTKQRARLERHEELKDRKAPVDRRPGGARQHFHGDQMGRTTLEARHVEKDYGDRILIVDDFSYIFLKNDRGVYRRKRMRKDDADEAFDRKGTARQW